MIPEGPLGVWGTARQAQFLSASNCRGPPLQAHRLLDEGDGALCTGTGPGLTPAITGVAESFSRVAWHLIRCMRCVFKSTETRSLQHVSVPPPPPEHDG